MEYRHIIWDWNGTLLNDRWLCIESINTLLRDRGKEPISEKKYLEIFDFPVKDYYERAGFDFSEEDFNVPALQFIDLYDLKRKECRLQKNAKEILEHFQNAGIGQSLLSASELGTLLDMVSHFRLGDYFHPVKGLNNHYAVSKLELGHELISKIGLPCSGILLVGDTRHDLEVARHLGVEVILYDQGHFPRRRLEGCACRIISDLIDLKTLVKEPTNRPIDQSTN